MSRNRHDRSIMNCLTLPAQGMSAGGGRRSTAETTKRQANVRPAAARMFRDGPSVAGRSQASLPRHKAVLQDLPLRGRTGSPHKWVQPDILCGSAWRQADHEKGWLRRRGDHHDRCAGRPAGSWQQTRSFAALAGHWHTARLPYGACSPAERYMTMLGVGRIRATQRKSPPSS